MILHSTIIIFIPTLVCGFVNKSSATELSASIAGRRYLKSLRGNCLSGADAFDVDMSSDCGDEEQWYIHDHQGKVSLEPRSHRGKYLRANVDTSVDLSPWRAADELWTPFQNMDGSWSFKSEPHGGWLSTGRDPAVHTVESYAAEKFRLDTWTEPATPKPAYVLSESPPLDAEASASIAGQRVLKSIYGTYLQTRFGGHGVGLGSIDDCTYWHIEDRKGKVALKPTCAEGKYLRGNRDGSVDLANRIGAHEMWTPINYQGGAWSFKSAHGKWLSADSKDHVSIVKALNYTVKFKLEPWTEKPLTQNLSKSTTKSASPIEAAAREHHPTGSHSISELHFSFILVCFVVLSAGVFIKRRRSNRYSRFVEDRESFDNNAVFHRY